MRLDKEIIREALRFCAVGVVATLLHYAIYWLLKRWINVNAAFVTGYILSFFCNFFLSAKFTFKSKASFASGLGFALSHLVNLGLQVSFLNLFLRIGLSDNFAPIPVYAICVPVNFLLVRMVFKKLSYRQLNLRFQLRNPIVALSLLCVFIVTLGLLPDWLQYGCFFVGGDFADQQIPFILETKRMLSSGPPLWSWNTYLGENFIAAYSFYTLTSPFVWIDCLFPENAITIGITLTLYLKFICAALAAYLYLRKMSVSKKTAVLGGLLYAFSSFTIVNINYYHFFEPLICFPLLLAAFESFLAGKKHGASALLAASFLCAFINWYFIPCSFISAGLYAICRCLGLGFRDNWKRTSQAVLLMVVGIAASSVVLLPTVLHLLGGSRAVSSVSIGRGSYGLLVWLQQFRSLFVPKVEEGGNISPWLFNTFTSNSGNLPVVGVLLSALYMLRHRDWLSLLLVCLLLTYLTPLNGIFSLFTNTEYSRWSYTLTLFIVLASVKYIDCGDRISGKALLVYIGISLVVVGVFYIPVVWQYVRLGLSPSPKALPVDSLILAAFVISLLCLCLFYRKQTLRYLVVLVVVFSACQLGMRVWGRTDSFYAMIDSIHSGVYRTYIKSPVPSGNCPIHYRSDFLTREGVVYANMPMLSDHAGISTYNSVRDKNIETLLATVDTAGEHWQGFFVSNVNREAFASLTSVRKVYGIKDERSSQTEMEGLVPVEVNDGYIEYEYRGYIPFGFTYDSFLAEDDLPPLTIENNIPLQLLANLTVRKEDAAQVSRYLPKGKLVTDSAQDSLVQARKNVVCSSFEGTSRGFSAKISLDRPNYVFFSVPADPGFTAFVDGERTPVLSVNLGLSAILVGEGSHSIEFKYLPRGLAAGACISLCCLLLGVLLFFAEDRRMFQRFRITEEA